MNTAIHTCQNLTVRTPNAERRTPNATIRTYQDLTAWQKAMALVKDIYQATQSWPREELYGLTNQVRRAAVSVPANIAEGKGRIGSPELLHHLSIATGSLAETETLLLIARDLGYIRDEDTQRILSQTNAVGQLIGGLRRSLRPPVRR